MELLRSKQLGDLGFYRRAAGNRFAEGAKVVEAIERRAITEPSLLDQAVVMRWAGLQIQAFLIERQLAPAFRHDGLWTNVLNQFPIELAAKFPMGVVFEAVPKAVLECVASI